GGMRTACVRLCDLAGCERAARTRNTGARMQESRAINSSLHVLERCLRMLRRKRTVTAIVPYRESKLTRLLGAGLSGTRGEAVSMVVTLNPSPEYANETRHVLQLAAVAKDIREFLCFS
ncbi:jg23291, partial [Pararge aegeria aegeria]